MKQIGNRRLHQLSISELSGVEVFRGISPGSDAVGLDSMLIIWNGGPAIMMWAHRPGGSVQWSGMTGGGNSASPMT